MASQVFASLEVAILRGLNLMRFGHFGLIGPKYPFRDCSVYSNRLFSSGICMRNSSKNSNSFEQLTEQRDQRDDLERLKKLLLHAKSRPPSTAEDTTKPAEEQHLDLKRAIGKRTNKSPATSVNVSKFKDILSVLKQGIVLTHTEVLEGYTVEQKPPTPMRNREITMKDEITKSSEDHDLIDQQPVQSSSVNVSKIKDALSHLGQDHSTSPTEEVIRSGRGRQLSPDSLSAIEGEINIKQRQIRDKDNRRRLPRNSLRTGPRSHWFYEVKAKWTVRQPHSLPTLFEEMAEKEVRDLSATSITQSGFQDLIENINRQWAFPIDNESCKKEEQEVGFEEHVFLEYLLDDFPRSGNIRQFMELVITGLQQNPYLSVQEKKEHIFWFKDYFVNMPDELVQV